ncbi:SE1561 family protein [Halobacillus sp. B29]|uniref:SE1561 family protein n=1 Tax=Halobacillus sp. B29 TaxID=3457432 RepID=UPI003FCCDC13
MGKAAQHPSDQFHYIKNRIKMLNQVVSSMDADEVDMDDFNRILEMIQQLQIKMERFKKDWDQK